MLTIMRRLITGIVAGLALVFGGILAAAPAQAATVTWDGTLSDGDASWQRPSCTGVGPNIEWFDTQDLSVDTDGVYTFQMLAQAPLPPSGTGADGYFLLYAAPFDPAAPLTNCIASDDDSGGGWLPRIVTELAAGDYVLVTTQCCDGITPDQAMSYTNQVTGPGDIRLTHRAPGSVQISPAAAAIPAGEDLAQLVVALSEQPSADVTIPLTSSDPALLAVPASVTIPAAEWEDGATFEVARLAAVTVDTTVSVETGLTTSADPRFSGLEVADVPVTLDARLATTTALEADPATVTIGEATAFTATVDRAGATGDVEFFDGGDSLGSAPLVDGTATLDAVVLPVGPRSVTATYAGDAAHAASASDPVIVTVERAASTTTLALAESSIVVGEDAALDVSVSGAAPSGEVAILRDGDPVGTVAAGTATTLVLADLPVGEHRFTAEYAGDAQNLGSASEAVVLTVAPAVLPPTPGKPETPAAPAPALPGTPTALVATGAGPGGPLAAAGLVLAAAGAILLAHRRRTRLH
ncbi:Ig-like domain-containing protein [Leucobacter allii]|uniref:Ig-like domain-containing protein n=1 Tax=Leucobacter allii TaxID=2932247 RepID=A0ABY4FKL9_9MICO|nr:Ig-like domain-containing protein [Leucobacter allii]UOQ56621.1 Ig-like domain-containing protein [Leucobacter allii]